MTPDEMDLVLRRLVAMGAPKDFVLLCLLCAFLAQGAFRGKHTWQVLEFFSGKARLSRLAAKCGYPVASFDLENDKGFNNRKKTSKHTFPHRSYMDFNGESGFALSVLLLFQSAFGRAVVWMAPVCSTWISINVGTSGRSVICPGGFLSFLQNRKANKSAARIGLLALLIAAMDSTFVIEQPASSLFFHYMYVRAAFQILARVGNKLWKTMMRMQLMGGPCPKRTILVSNSCRVNRLQTGRLVRAMQRTTVATTVRYRNANGKLRYKGSKKLKSTQQYPARFARHVVQTVRSMQRDSSPWNLPVPTEELHDVIFACPCTTWSVAEIKDSVRYLRGAKDLEIPPEFRPLFPDEMWEGFDPVESDQGLY